MTVLPSSSPFEVNGTFGATRTALKDIRDFIAGALGTSSETPFLKNPIISGCTYAGFGLNMNNPGTTVQIAGGLSVYPNNATSPDPGVGSAYIYNRIQFADILSNKLNFHTNQYALGVQNNTLFFRSVSRFSFHQNGSFSVNEGDPGGGVTLFDIHPNALQYKSTPVYTVATHGTLANINLFQGWSQQQNFGAGIHVTKNHLIVGHTNNDPLEKVKLHFNYFDLGERIHFVGVNNPNYSMGIQDGTLFLRTGYSFAVYQGGTYNPNLNNPGNGGSALLVADPSQFTYRGQAVFHTGLNGHGRGIDADTVDGIHAASFITKHSTARPGALVLYRWDADAGHMMRFAWDGTRMRFYAWDGGSTGWETMTDHSSHSDTCYGNAATATHALYSHPSGTIAQSAHNDPNRKTSIINMAHALANDGINMQMHHDNGYMRLLTTSGHPTLVGRADTATNADNLTGGIGVSRMHKAQGSARVNVIAVGQTVDLQNITSRFAVNQYSFGSPRLSLNHTGRYVWCSPSIDADNSNDGETRWRMLAGGVGSGLGGCTATWDYLTNSGHPELWAVPDSKGNLIALWESEDPLNNELTTAPIDSAVRVKIPTIGYLLPMIEKIIQSAKLPKWLDASVYKGAKTPSELLSKMLARSAQDRSYEMYFAEDTDLREFVLTQTEDSIKRDWRVQMILRSLARVYTGSLTFTMIPLIQDNFVLRDKRTGILDLK